VRSYKPWNTCLCNVHHFLREKEKKEKQQLTIFYGGKVLVFDDFPAGKAKDLMQLAGKGSPVVQNAGLPQSSAPATVTTKVQKVAPVPAPVSTLPPGAQADAPKPVRPNASGNYSSFSSCSCYQDM
jgi:jasmonate ZIM domain-containing protein